MRVVDGENRCDPPQPNHQAFDAHLKSKGKESKVAIVACNRKLVTILNLLVKSNPMWQTK